MVRRTKKLAAIHKKKLLDEIRVGECKLEKRSPTRISSTGSAQHGSSAFIFINA